MAILKYYIGEFLLCLQAFILRVSVSVVWFQELKCHRDENESYGKQWAVGDCVGVFLDMVDHTISK